MNLYENQRWNQVKTYIFNLYYYTYGRFIDISEKYLSSCFFVLKYDKPLFDKVMRWTLNQHVLSDLRTLHRHMNMKILEALLLKVVSIIVSKLNLTLLGIEPWSLAYLSNVPLNLLKGNPQPGNSVWALYIFPCQFDLFLLFLILANKPLSN